MIPSLLVEIPHHQCVIWPHRDDLDGYHIKIPNLNDVTGQLALGNAYKIPHPKQEGISHRRHSSTPTGLYQVMHMKHITAKTHWHSWASDVFSDTDFKMKLVILTFALIGAVLASPNYYHRTDPLDLAGMIKSHTWCKCTGLGNKVCKTC